MNTRRPVIQMKHVGRNTVAVIVSNKANVNKTAFGLEVSPKEWKRLKTRQNAENGLYLNPAAYFERKDKQGNKQKIPYSVLCNLSLSKQKLRGNSFLLKTK